MEFNLTENAHETFLRGLENAILRVQNSRYFETERGYQGALIAELQNELSSFNWENAIIEQEYQKRFAPHGIRVRPDIIIHVPFDSDEHNTHGEGNFVVFELKLNARESAALTDLDNLSQMCSLLNYPLGVFININATSSHIENYMGENKDKLIGYSVTLSDGQVSYTREQATA
jgi:hypothetical protein